MSEFENKPKRQKKVALPSSIISAFTSSEGERAGPAIELQLSSTQKQMETLINALLSNEDIMPYAFYVNGIEIVSSLEETIKQQLDAGENFSFEDMFNITYQPLSVFKVRPVTRCSETMPGHTEAVLHVSYSPDGTRLASGGGDMAVRFWNVNSSTPLFTCTGHRDHVLCTAWSPDGKIFVSGDRSGEIRIWDPSTGVQIGHGMRGHKKWITSLSFEPYHMDPTCRRMVSSSKDHTCIVWNLKTQTMDTCISGHADSVECVKWGGNGFIYTASRDRMIKVWAIDGHGRSKHKLVRSLTGHAHRINSIALNCDYTLRTGPYQLGDKGSLASIINASDSDSAVTSSEMLASQQKALEKYRSVIGTEGEILASCSDDFTIFLWKPEVDKKPILRMTGHQQLINHIAFSPDGRYLASASFDKKVKVWCGKTGRFISTLTGHVGAVYQVAWSADSCHLVSSSKDSVAKLWNISKQEANKKAIFTLPGHADEVYTVDWSPNGTQVATGSKDRTIKIWRH